MQKTTQAIKVLATFTPFTEVALGMLDAVFNTSPGWELKFSSGKMVLKAAIAVDFSAPADVVLASQQADKIHKSLEARGTVHSFKTSAGAVPVDDCVPLPGRDVADKTGEPATTED